MVERLFIAGSGGQGIVLVGKLLAAAAIENISHVTFFPSYGAEVRGGTSNCQVILSSEEIASPVLEQFDSLIIMNQASADKFTAQTADNALIVINSSLCKINAASSATAIPATELADELGDTRAANIIMLGAYLAKRKVVSPAGIEKEIERSFAGKTRGLIDLNIKAFRTGLKF